MKNTLVVVICLLVFLKGGFAQSPVKYDEFAERIPFGFTGKLIILKATINGIQGFACLDTGHRGVVLNEEFFNGKRSSLEIIGVNNNSLPVKETEAIIEIGKMSKRYNRVMVTPFAQLWKKGTPLLAIVGWGFFEDKVVRLDYESKLLEILSSKQSARYIADNDLEYRHILKEKDFLIINVKYNQHNYKMILDTGAEINIIQQNIIASQGETGIDNALEIAGFGGERVSEMTSLSGMYLAGYEMPAMRTAELNMWHINSELKRHYVDGILGYEFFNQSPVLLNLQDYKMYIGHSDTSYGPDVVSVE